MSYPGNHAPDNGEVYSPEQLELLRAMQTYQRENRRRFPAFTEVLAVLIALGWRKVEKAGPLPVYHADTTKGWCGGQWGRPRAKDMR